MFNLVLRAFYLRYNFVNGDEAVRALTAVGWLDGGRLYLDVITDKPPGATMFYSMIFRLFGHSMPAVHLGGIIWNFLTTLAVFAAGLIYGGRRLGLWASLIFVYFSTNYLTQDMMAANTELLLILPYTLAVLLYVREHKFISLKNDDKRKLIKVIHYIAAGILTGISIVFKQVGVFALVFFLLFEAAIIVLDSKNRRNGVKAILRDSADAAVRLSLVLSGVLIVSIVFLFWLIRNGAAHSFWRNAVVLGAAYIGSLPTNLWIKFMITRIGGYILFNISLWSLAIWVTWIMLKKLKALNWSIDKIERKEKITFAFSLWGLVSLSGVFTSGRFYGHYFIQVLPALSLLAAYGVLLIKKRPYGLGKILTMSLIIAATLFGMVRFHHRTAILAYETVTGTRTRFSEAWGMTKRERETAEISPLIREWAGVGKPLYIWGYALDIYWLSGCKPASRYLSPYYVTGHFYPEVTSINESSEGPLWGIARRQLLEDLARTKPTVILDRDECIMTVPYPEIVEFMKENYKYDGVIGTDPSLQLRVYRLVDKPGKIERSE